MNLAAFVDERFRRLWSQFVFRAVVTGTSGELVTIQRTGQAEPDEQSYPRLASYGSPEADDEVVVVWLGGYIVVGKVVR